MRITRRVWKTVVLAILVITWLGPLHRVGSGWRQAVAIDREIGSLNSSDDVWW